MGRGSISANLSHYRVSAKEKTSGSKCGLQHRCTEDGWTTIPDMRSLKLWWLPILAEFVGSTFLVYLAALSWASPCSVLPFSTLLALLGTVAPPGGASAGTFSPAVDLLQAEQIPDGFIGGIPLCSTTSLAAGIGFSALSLVAIFGHISGGHFNPQVTLGLTLIGAVEPAKAVLYVAVQIVGSIVGSAAAWGTLGESKFQKGVLDAFNGLSRFTWRLDEPIQLGRALKNGEFFITEFLSSAFLVAVYVGVSFDKRAPKNLAPVMIGFTYLAIGSSVALFYSIGNPLFAFGAAVLYGEFARHWLFWVSSLAGGVVGGQVYRWFFLVPEDTNALSSQPNASSKKSQLSALSDAKESSADV